MPWPWSTATRWPRPTVVAKGQNLLAQQIKEIARWDGIPIVENPPLAQSLYRTVEVGQAIPEKLYAAVAEILAYVFRMNAQHGAEDFLMAEAHQARVILQERQLRLDRSGRRRLGRVFVMLVPMPSFLLDLLLAMSITASVIVLLSAVYILRPVQFSVFPSLLLLLTLFRLALNLASSRRILLHGNEGTAAAGMSSPPSDSSSSAATTWSASCFSSPSSRFSFWSSATARCAPPRSPRASPWTPCPASRWRLTPTSTPDSSTSIRPAPAAKPLAREAEFYGAMDGAARFSQRDSLATILLTAINIVAGFLIGVFQLDIPFRDALKTYTVLTVGDGLVTMIPSLLVSIAGGLVVTRASSNHSLGGDLGQQLFAQPRVLWIAGAAMFAMGMIPGMPKFSFLLMVSVLWIMAWRLQKMPAAAENKAGCQARSRRRQQARNHSIRFARRAAGAR